MAQSVVTQSHIDAQSLGAGSPAARLLPVTTAARKHSAPSPAACPICREMAQAGHYLSPDPVLFAIPGLAPRWTAPLAHPRSVRQDRWVGWRSRAPPPASEP